MQGGEERSSVMIEDAEDAWMYWSEMLDRPYASSMVSGLNQAVIALHRVMLCGCQEHAMEQWLRQWPTESGWMRYERDKCRELS